MESSVICQGFPDGFLSVFY